jgi:hypothetical protein
MANYISNNASRFPWTGVRCWSCVGRFRSFVWIRGTRGVGGTRRTGTMPIRSLSWTGGVSRGFFHPATTPLYPVSVEDRSGNLLSLYRDSIRFCITVCSTRSFFWWPSHPFLSPFSLPLMLWSIEMRHPDQPHYNYFNLFLQLKTLLF